MFLRLILIFLSGVLFGGSVSAQIFFQDNFDSARLDSAYRANSGEYTLAPHISLNCRAVGVRDSMPVFRIFDWEGYRLRHDHKMVYSYTGEEPWYFFDNSAKTGSVDWYYFSNNTPFLHDTVYIAYWFPWSYSQQEDFMQEIHGTSPFLKNDSVRGLSQQGRNIWGYEITDPTVADCYKKNVVWMGRQHPTEFKQNYITNGMTEYLLYSQDPIADSLRRYFRFHFYPMVNPDGVFLGLPATVNGIDPNRAWIPGWNPGQCQETNVVREAIENDCDGQVFVGFDIHSNAGHRGAYYYYGQKTGPQAADAAHLVEAIFLEDSAASNGQPIIADSILADTWQGTAFTAGNWLNQTCGAISYTLEPGTVPTDSISRLEALGASIAKGLWSVHGQVVPMQVSFVTQGISCFGQQDAQASVTVSGGFAPWQFDWSTGDTLSTLNGLGASILTCEVTDDEGCEFEWEWEIIEPPVLELEPIVKNTPCYGTSDGSIELQVQGGTPDYSFLWSAGDTNSFVPGLSAGIYWVNVEDENGCFLTDTFEITEPAMLGVGMSSGPAAFGMANGWAEAIAYGGTQPYTYLWSDSLGQTNSVATGLAPGWYTVLIHDGNGCEVIDSVEVMLEVGLEEELGASWNVFPNPVQDWINISGAFRDSGELSLHIFDISGKILLSQKLERPTARSAGNEVYRFNLSQLPAGTYWLRISSEGENPVMFQILRK